MRASGFVLAGGGSRRMGRDKALLPYGGRVLAGHVAETVQKALDGAGPVTILGDFGRYGSLGYPVQEDLVASCGPLGGLLTALRVSQNDWNLLVACDMPKLEASGLRMLLERAWRSAAACVAAVGPGGELEPLCAVYHRRCLPVLERAHSDKIFRMRDILPELQPERVAFAAAALANVNTPEQWIELEEQAG